MKPVTKIENNDKIAPMFSTLNPAVYKRLEAAVEDIFSNSDFHKANIRDVAKKAGISFSTIYHHFGNKEKLLFSFVDIWLGKLCDRIVDHLQGIEDLKEKMRKVFWLQLDYYERNQGLGRILFMTVPMKTWMEDETFVQEKMIRIYLDVLKKGQAEGILNPKIGTEALLDLMMGFVQRTFFMWVSRGKTKGLAEQANALFEIVWRGITNPEMDKTA
ncbi:MAG: TetR/AcrR family transcriptional regulator [Pseudomonadota bacterium]